MSSGKISEEEVSKNQLSDDDDEEVKDSEKEEEEEEEEEKLSEDKDDDKEVEPSKAEDNDNDDDKDDDDDEDVEESDNEDDESPNIITNRSRMNTSNMPLKSKKSKQIQKEDDDFVEVPKNQESPISLSNEELIKIYQEKKNSKGKKERFLLKNVHTSPISFVAVTAPPESEDDNDDEDKEDEDGLNTQYMVSASSDPKEASVKLFNLKTRKLVQEWKKPHKDAITAMVATSDASYIITASKDKSIKIYDVYMKDESEHFENIHEGFIVNSLAVSNDNKYLISGAEGSIKVFDLLTKKEISHIKDPKLRLLHSVAITPDNKLILAGTLSQVQVYDFETKSLVKEFKDLDLTYISCMVVTPDSKFLLVSSKTDRGIKMLDLQTKKDVHYFKEADPLSIKSFVVTSDSRYLICLGILLRVYDLQTKQLIHSSHSDKRIESMTVTSDSKYIIAGLEDGSIKVLDFDPKMEVHHFKEIHETEITTMVVTPDGKYLITGSEDMAIKVFDLQTRKEFHHFEDAHEDGITSLAVTSDSKFIVSGSSDKTIKIFDIQNKTGIYNLEEAFSDDLIQVVVTRDSKFIVAAGDVSKIKVWDFKTKKLLKLFEDDSGDTIESLTVTSDSRFIVSADYERVIKVFDLRTFEEVYHMENSHEKNILSMAVTPDRRFIIGNYSDGWIKMFDFQTKQLVHEFHNVESDDDYRNGSMVVTSDSKYLILCSDADCIRVLDIQTGKPIHHLKNMTEMSVNSITVTPDNRYIIWSDDFQSIKMYDFYPNDEPQPAYLQNIIKSPSKEPETPAFGSKSSKIFDLSARQKEIAPDPSNHLIQTPSLLNQEIYFVHEEARKLSIFNNADDFLFNKTAEISIAQAIKQPDLFVLPFRWTILHLVSLHGNHDFIAKMPEYKKFKMPFLVDSFDRTPMHYLIVQKNLRASTINVLFRYICDYLDDCHLRHPSEFQKIIQSLTPLLPFILQKIESKLRCRFLQISCTKSSIPHSKPLPVFGTIESESTIFCKSPVLLQETRELIWGEQGTTQIEFRSNYLYLDYHILSQDMKEIVDDLKGQDGEEIFKAPAISTLIDHLWKQSERALYVIFFLYSAFIIALSVYLTFNDRSLPYEIILIIGAATLTVNEFWQIYNLTTDYLKSPWNWLDLVQLLLTIAFLITRICDSENELARAWMSTIIVIGGYLRWISLLKIFKPTRNFIEVVITIVKDMISFVVVIAMIIIAFSIIFLVFNREAGYGDYLYEAYNVMYGPMDIDEGAAWPFSQKLLMAVLAFFLNVVLLNLLISIMGDSFGRVAEARDKTDSLTRLEMISEAMIFRRILNPNHQTKRGYLVYCLPVEEEEEESDQQEQLNKMTAAIKQLQQNDEESKKEYQSLKDQISSLDTFIRASLKK